MISTLLTEAATASPLGTFLAGLVLLAAAALVVIFLQLGITRMRNWGEIGGWLLRGLLAVDRGLVDYGSYAVGTRWEHPRTRWAVLLSVFGAIAAGGVLLPWPWAIWLLVLGLAGVLVVVRHWAHDQGETRRGVAPENKRIPISGGLIPEILTASAFVLIYAPIAFARFHAAGHQFELRPDAGPFAFVLFTLLELLKVVPIIDYY